MVTNRVLQVLLLCDYRKDIAATVRDHIEALCKLSQHVVRRVSVFGDIPERLDLNRFDVIVIHYSLIACNDAYLSSRARSLIRSCHALRTVFVQDEYRHVDCTIGALYELGVNVLFTCVPGSEIEKVYPEAQLPGVRKVNTLTGFVSEELVKRKVPSWHNRPIDVGYRSRKVPAWLGQLGQEKWRIGERFLLDSARYGLRCDISCREEDRLYGKRWIDFVGDCKAMLGVESGSSVFDFTGDLQARVEQHLMSRPKTPFEELRKLYFQEQEGKIRLNQISPRCFEMAALRTLMILYEGEYSGILKPWCHYVPLAKDHSNMDEVVAVLRDREACESIIGSAYEEVALNPAYSYPTFVKQFDRILEISLTRKLERAVQPYTAEEFQHACRPSPSMRLRRARRDTIDAAYRFFFGRMLKFLPPRRKDTVQLWLKRLFRVLRPRRRHA
jgi:hypothetical protein